MIPTSIKVSTFKGGIVNCLLLRSYSAKVTEAPSQSQRSFSSFAESIGLILLFVLFLKVDHTRVGLVHIFC